MKEMIDWVEFNVNEGKTNKKPEEEEKERLETRIAELVQELQDLKEKVDPKMKQRIDKLQDLNNTIIENKKLQR